MRVWQLAAGDRARDYSSLLVQHDIAIMGPGKFGPFNAQSAAQYGAVAGVTPMKAGYIKSLCTKMKPGDVVLLRRGHRVVSIGVVSGDYEWDQNLDDVFGWDLQHRRRVIWQDELHAELVRMQRGKQLLFNHMKQIPTFTRVKDVNVLDRVHGCIERCVIRPLRELPPLVPAPLSDEEVGHALFERGLSNTAVENVLGTLRRQRRLLKWYESYGETSVRPDEHEVVAYMVVPLLLALGWSEQLLAVEWHKVDVAGFSRTPSTNDRCVLVCEAKHMRHGLQTVLDQAIDYVRDLKLDDCRKILLTQGGRFYLYQRDLNTAADGGWERTPRGYVNLQKIRRNHLAPAGTDGIATLMGLTPVGVHQPQAVIEAEGITTD